MGGDVVIAVSYCRHTFQSKRLGHRTLHQSQITDWAEHADWDEFVQAFLQTATYPRPSEAKTDIYGWTPTWFEPSDRLRSDGELEHGVWRDGSVAADHLTLFIADLDNHQDDQPRVSIDTVSEVLTALGVAHLLYTSHSHTPEKHKVRIVTPVSRHLTPDEAHQVFTVLSHALAYQLDGSIYDPGDFLYGPGLASTVVRAPGEALDVDEWLGWAEALPDHVKARFVRQTAIERRQPTSEEIAQAKRMAQDLRVQDGVSIHDPRFFNPDWFDLLTSLYVGGSRHQTVQGLLIKAWLKSDRNLTRGDLEILQGELDAELGGYLRRQYGSHVLRHDITSVMNEVSSVSFTPRQTDEEIKQSKIAKELARLKNRRAN